MKKKSLLFTAVFSILFAAEGRSQWTRVGTNTQLINLGDYVGVGNTAPTFGGNKFEVMSGGVLFQSTQGGRVRFENPNLEEGMSVHTTSNTRADFRVNGSSLKLGFHGATGVVPTSNLLFVTAGGSFGIGVSPATTAYKLTVNGDTKVQGFLDVQQGGSGPNALKVWGLTTASLVDVQSSNATSITPFNAKTGLFVNRTDGNDVNTSGAEIHGQTLGLRTTAMSAFSSANTLGVDVSSLTFDGSSTGINVESKGSTTTYGVFSKANAIGPTSVGVYGYANTTSAVKSAVYGVQGELPPNLWNLPNCYAGYFNGGLYVVGNSYRTGSDNYTSDRKLKKDIESIKGALESIMKLRPSKYEFKTDEYIQMNLPQGKRFGFIAQELEEVFPVLVKQTRHPETKDKDGNIVTEAVDFKSVSYIELIPVLTAAIQEQQTQIERQQAQIEELKKMLASSNANGTTGNGNNTADVATKGYLSQNVPNPFTQSTVISYQLPANTKTAGIGVYDLNGREIKLYTLGAETTGSVTIDGGSMQAGMYVYTLLVNGMPYETKKMVLTSR